ncbi:unnamed protein product [Rangifer tarandus platyrhynchus]|uniref:Uncharacterized protein n=1 Tax=Rangifer tarandus platyrhynchus TaxID=3082113 RepID=A0AC59YI74_RANTA
MKCGEELERLFEDKPRCVERTWLMTFAAAKVSSGGPRLGIVTFPKRLSRPRAWLHLWTVRWGSLSPAEVFLDALWGEREPLSPGPPGGAPAAWCPSSQGEEGSRQTPRPQKEPQWAGGGPKAAAQKCLGSPNTGATRGQGRSLSRFCQKLPFGPAGPEKAPFPCTVQILTPCVLRAHALTVRHSLLPPARGPGSSLGPGAPSLLPGGARHAGGSRAPRGSAACRTAGPTPPRRLRP